MPGGMTSGQQQMYNQYQQMTPDQQQQMMQQYPGGTPGGSATMQGGTYPNGGMNNYPMQGSAGYPGPGGMPGGSYPGYMGGSAGGNMMPAPNGGFMNGARNTDMMRNPTGQSENQFGTNGQQGDTAHPAGFQGPGSSGQGNGPWSGPGPGGFPGGPQGQFGGFGGFGGFNGPSMQGGFGQGMPGGMNGQGMMGPGAQGMTSSDTQEQMKKQQTEMLTQMSDHATRECKNLSEPINHWEHAVPDDLKSKVQAVADQCIALVASTFGGATGDPGQIGQTFFSQMGQFHQQVAQILQSQSQQQSACDGARFAVAGMKNGAANEAPDFIARVRSEGNTAKADEMESFRQKTLAAVADAEQKMASDDCQGAQNVIMSLEQEMQQLMGKFGGIQQDAFVNHRAVADQFTQQLSKQGITGFNGQDFLNKGFTDTNHFTFASQLVNFGGKDTAEALKTVAGANVIKNLAGNVTSDQMGDVAELLKQISELRSKINDLQAQLSEQQRVYAEKFSALAVPEISDKVGYFVQNVLPNTTDPKQLEGYYQAAKLEAGDALVKKGLADFIDVSPTIDWSARYVHEAANAGITTGVDAEHKIFGSTEKSTGDQVMTMVARAVGLNENATLPADLQGKVPAWAEKSVATLIESGVDVKRIFGNDFNKPATRKQIGEVIYQLVGDQLPQANISDVQTFSDAHKLKTPEEQKAFAVLHEAGIFTGNRQANGQVTLNPDAPVQRDELVKVIVVTAQKVNEGQQQAPESSGAPALEKALPENSATGQ